MVDQNEHTEDASASAAPRRRRAARRPAGPPVEHHDLPEASLGEVADETVEEFPEEAPEEEPDAAAEGEAPDVGDLAGAEEEAEAAEDEAPEGEAPEGEAPEGEAPEGEAPEGEGETAPVTAETGGRHRGSRRSRRATRGVTTVAFSAESDDQPVPITVRAAEVPVVALFQPPDESLAVARRRRARPSGAAQGRADVDAADEAGDDAPGAAEQDEHAEHAEPAEPDEHAEPAEHAEPDEHAEAAGSDEHAELDEGDDTGPRRRRRRGGRRRRRPGQGESESPDELGQASEPETGATEEEVDRAAAGEPGAGDTAEGGPEDESAGSRRRRRRRRRAGVSEEMEDLSSDEPANTVVKVREGRRPSDEITSVRGSTRIEAKKQRRRDGREAGRRRAPILTEAEFLARRESVNRVMCVREHGDRTQIAVLEDGVLVEHYVNRAESSSMVGNVYLGRVQNVLPSMEAAFVDIGRGRNAVLYAGEVNWEAAGLEGQPKRIELALKSGDSVLVQVTKDPIGHKGARLTSQISLPGRFLVYVPEGSMTGISRKLPDTERARLKGILKDVVPEGAGVIVRTAAEGATEEQLTADVRRLTAQWTDITRKAKSVSAPSLLYGEPDLAIKVVRDIFNEDFTTLLVQGDPTWQTLSEYIGWVAPDLVGKLVKWVEPTDLYAAHRIDEQLAKALDRKVWLPSGGSLVIDRTEAMTVVDVNTGKFTGQGGNLEETVTKNNLEAAEEIVRQLRLRDIGGIIVVDFIDMVLESNRDLVLRRLVECLGRDRTKHQVAEVTSLGLVQMTRKRIGQGLLEVFSTPCEACGGRGHVVHTEPVGADDAAEDRGRRGNGDRSRHGGRQAQPSVHLGGKQTGKTPPPPKFDEHGHIDHTGAEPGEGHDEEHVGDELAGHREEPAAPEHTDHGVEHDDHADDEHAQPEEHAHDEEHASDEEPVAHAEEHASDEEPVAHAEDSEAV